MWSQFQYVFRAGIIGSVLSFSSVGPGFNLDPQNRLKVQASFETDRVVLNLVRGTLPTLGSQLSFQTLSSNSTASACDLRNMIRVELSRNHLPVSLIAVVKVESGFQPSAQSNAGAVGLWQLMPATARAFGLHVSDVYDDRYDPVLSTRAALKFIQFLYQRYGALDLVLTAYNMGPTRLDRQCEKVSFCSFETLKQAHLLPEETERYVPWVKSFMDAFDTEHDEECGKEKLVGERSELLF